MAFMHNLNFCMQQKGYSAYRLSKIIGASNQAVLLWQSGKTIPHQKTRQKIADHFGITLEELDGDKIPVLPPESAKKQPAANSDELTDTQKTAIDMIKSMSDSDLEMYLEILKTIKKKKAD